MSCDKTGAVVDRIVEGEVDHGQHDAVRDVFVAPGGCILVRADLFSDAQGIRRRDRGHGGGPRPVVAQPGRRVTRGRRARRAGAPPRSRRRRARAAGGRAAEAQGRHPVTMQMLQRRHELRAVLKCYTRFHLVRVLPQAALLAFGEVVVAVLARDGDRVRAVTGAWRWNARRLQRDLRCCAASWPNTACSPTPRCAVSRCGAARGCRATSAASPTRVSPRPTRRPSHGSGSDRRRASAREVAVLTGSVGVGLQRGHGLRRARRPGPAGGPGPLRPQGPVRSARAPGANASLAMVIALVVIAFGTRELFFGTLPLVGQLAPLPSWSTSWHHFFSGWQSAGVGTTAPASPAFGIVGITGTVLFGAMGTLQRVLLLGCIPLGAWGVSRFMRPLVSPRARVVAVICYLGLPLPYGALGHGPLGRPRRLRRLPVHRPPAGPERPGSHPFGVEPGPTMAHPSVGPDRRPGCTDRRGVGLRARRRPDGHRSRRWPGRSARSSSGRATRVAGPPGGRSRRWPSPWCWPPRG